MVGRAGGELSDSCTIQVMRLLAAVLVATCWVGVGASSAVADLPYTGAYSVRSCPTLLTANAGLNGGWSGATFATEDLPRPALSTCGSNGTFGIDMSDVSVQGTAT